MRAIDTNVLARFVMRDDPTQTARAEQAITGGAIVPATVMLEFAWLLQSRYGLSRADVALTLKSLVESEDFSFDDAVLMSWAIERFSAGADFADMLHLAGARGLDAFLTFDRAITRRAGPTTPVAIVTL